MSACGRPKAIIRPVVHDRHPIAEPLGLVHVVGGEQDGAPVRLEAFDQLPELPAGLRIEAGGRLIQEEQLGVADQRAGQGQALLLAAGKRTHPGARLFLELDHGDDLGRGGATIVEAAKQLDRFVDGELLGELGFLEGDSEELPQLPLIPVPAPAQHDHFARVRGIESLADLDSGCLAGAVGAEQAETLTGVDLEIEVVDGHDVLVGLTEMADLERDAGVGRRHGENHNAAQDREARPSQALVPRPPRPGVAEGFPDLLPLLRGQQQDVAGEHSPHVNRGLNQRGGIGRSVEQHG